MDDISQFLDRHFAKPMFILALVFLFFLAGVLHFTDGEVGVAGAIKHMSQSAKEMAAKRKQGKLKNKTQSTETSEIDKEKAGDLSQKQGVHPSKTMKKICTTGIFILYPIFIMELLFVIWKKSPRWKRYLLYSLIPPLRLAGRDHTTGKMIWLPKTGWVAITEDLQDRIEKGFTIPMIVIALMVVPLLALEMVYKEVINNSPYLTVLVQMAAGLIWLAFTYEFIVLISIVEKKKEYCKKHWIDIAVILLPLIAFMRLGRLGRLGRLTKLQKTARLYRLRGMLMRTYRALLLFNLIDRYLLRKSPEKMLADLKQKFMDKEEELDEIRTQMQALESQIELAAVEAEESAETETKVA